MSLDNKLNAQILTLTLQFKMNGMDKDKVVIAPLFIQIPFTLINSVQLLKKKLDVLKEKHHLLS